jgi:peptide/nickel transport system ATP-binding protein
MLSQRGAARAMSGTPAQAGDEILSVRNLHTHFLTYAGVVKALNGFDLQVRTAEMSALVGESGSGKSVAAWSVLGLPKAPGKIIEGEVQWHGQDILRMPKERLKRLRGNQISLILSSPRSNLHPLLRVGDQIQAVHQAHHQVPRSQSRETTMAMLKAVGLDPRRVFHAYPHELSGGMAQRIIIAAALINSPELVIADDATNGLDVTVQRQVLDLMTRLIQQRRSSTLVITHDLGIVAQYCSRATVMYAGQAVEVASTKRLFNNPLHPYTQALIGAIRSKAAVQRKPLPGLPPDPMALPTGCFLHPRCPARRPECAEIRPTLRQVERGHWVRCILYPEMEEAAPGDQAGLIANTPHVGQETALMAPKAEGAE